MKSPCTGGLAAWVALVDAARAAWRLELNDHGVERTAPRIAAFRAYMGLADHPPRVGR